MIRYILMVLLSLHVGLVAADRTEEERSSSAEDHRVQLAQLPDGVLEAAREAKPGVYFKEAERVWWRDEPVYLIMGSEFRTDWSVYVNVQGEILHIDSDVRD